MGILDSLRPVPGLRVLVTAGGSGIGAAVARAFAEAGAQVHVCDVNRSALDRMATEAPGITSSMADVAIERDVELVFDDVLGTLGGLDVLVNNAGVPGPTGAIESLDTSHWGRTVAVNLNSQFLFARRAVPLLKQSRAGPCIVAMGALAERLGYAYRTPYASTKWAVLGLMQSLAIELGPHDVRVNAILPGTVEADHVAALALYLCSPAARNVTGQAISVDGAMDHPWKLSHHQRQETP